ncbi:MAG: DEAD/DEAH box helicase family protein [Gemmataceae bacterium]
MNRHVNAIAGRLSLRPPQLESLKALDRICDIAPPKKDADREAALAAIRAEFPGVTDFEREFPSVCFALATGVGKTRLMGAFISYLYLAHGFKNFFVLAPNLTIYNKLITDFSTRTHPKYVFQGIQDFAINAPNIITGDNYESQAASLYDKPDDCKVNIFNISKISFSTEAKSPGSKSTSARIKRLSEYIGESYFEYLSKLPDLVLLMDESHRYRASAGAKAINDLKPVLGLELTATPFEQVGQRSKPFKNVIVDYPLARAMADGFVKKPAVVTRKDFNPTGLSAKEIERIKLEDGVRLHETVRAELATYARQSGRPFVKPFVLVIAKDTTHARELHDLIREEKFFDGRYKDAVIQVDSSQKEDEVIERLLKVESPDEPTEIVIHVNMLKEGWDVTNLYTIIPLRAANARSLIEQSIGRGLRLPYGKRTGVNAVDRLNIVAHDKFQEIVDDAKEADSPIRLQQLLLDPADMAQKPISVPSQPAVMEKLGIAPPGGPMPTPAGAAPPPPMFATAEERKIAAVAYDVLRTFENKPDTVPSLAALQSKEIQKQVVEEVKRRLGPQPTLPGMDSVAAVVSKTTEQVVLGTIDIPRILVVPKGEVKSGFTPFKLDLKALRYQPPSEELVAQALRTGEQERISLGRGGIEEHRLEDFVVAGLVDFDDVSYDDHADLLYDLATQTVKHFRGYLKDDGDVRNVLRVYQKPIAEFIHIQMLEHFEEDTIIEYEVVVSKGFTELKESAYTANAKDKVLDLYDPPPDKSKIAQYLYTGFGKGLYRLTKFQSDTERKMAIILEKGAKRWFRPAKGQFQIFYRVGHDQQEYLPDFVAETDDAILLIELKAGGMTDDATVQAKKDAGVKWCSHATEYAHQHGGKPWKYVFVPHDAVAENMTLKGIVSHYSVA